MHAGLHKVIFAVDFVSLDYYCLLCDYGCEVFVFFAIRLLFSLQIPSGHLRDQ